MNGPETNDYYADRLNVAWEILRHVAAAQLPRHLQAELGPVIDDVLEAASRLRTGALRHCQGQDLDTPI